MRLTPTAGQQQYLASIGVPPLTATADSLSTTPRSRSHPWASPKLNGHMTPEASLKPDQPAVHAVPAATPASTPSAPPTRRAAAKGDTFSPKAAGWVIAAAGLIGFIAKLLLAILVMWAIPVASVSAQEARNSTRPVSQPATHGQNEHQPLMPLDVNEAFGLPPEIGRWYPLQPMDEWFDFDSIKHWFRKSRLDTKHSADSSISDDSDTWQPETANRTAIAPGNAELEGTNDSESAIEADQTSPSNRESTEGSEWRWKPNRLSNPDLDQQATRFDRPIDIGGRPTRQPSTPSTSSNEHEGRITWLEKQGSFLLIAVGILAIAVCILAWRQQFRFQEETRDPYAILRHIRVVAERASDQMGHGNEPRAPSVRRYERPQGRAIRPDSGCEQDVDSIDRVLAEQAIPHRDKVETSSGFPLSPNPSTRCQINAFQSAWSIGADSIVGRVRTENQDFVRVETILGLQVILVADGCGGTPFGGHASALAVGAAYDELRRRVHNNHSADQIRMAVIAAMNAAQDRLATEAAAGGIMRGLQTTLMIVVRGKKDYVFGQIGDGAALVLRQRGDVHTFFEPQREAQTNVIVACLGPVLIGKPTFGVVPRQTGDLVLVGTDGVFDFVAGITEFAKDVLKVAIERDGRLLDAATETVTSLAKSKEDDEFVCTDNLSLALMADGRPKPGPAFWQQNVTADDDNSALKHKEPSDEVSTASIAAR